MCRSLSYSGSQGLNFRGMITIFTIGFVLICIGGSCMALEADKEVVLRGRVVCVNEDRMEVSCESEGRLFALKVDDGRKFIFLPKDPNSRVFEDQRLHQRELQVKAWDRGQNQLEIIKVYSVKDGKLFDINYFCHTCNLTNV